ncbi:MAG TPA: ribose-5-phosphate isomerase RpiA [Gemmatimonadales bacterium]|nr:ribose-5-phosphate isomerase RpiA [Gemmatimonadales bacterium]
MPESAAQGSAAAYKQHAAECAVELVQSGMVVGLGTGSTAVFAIRRIGLLLQSGQLRDVVGVPTSAAAEAEARTVGIQLIEPELAREVDLTIDGADEVTPELDLIKGRGGALLREKVVAQASRREVIVVDQSKVSPRLGTHSPLPVEVLRFGWRSQARFLESLGARVELMSGSGGSPFVTDEGNLVLLCFFGPLAAPADLAQGLAARAGIVEHGLFLGLATDLIVAGPGGIEQRVRPTSGKTS